MNKFNDWLALRITKGVGTMYCAYIFAVVGGMGVYFSLTNDTKGTLIIGSVSGYFLQLVLLPIIIVGQNLQAQKHDEVLRHVKKLRNLSPDQNKENKAAS